MDFEALLKIATLVAAIFAIPKILRELSDLKFTRLKSNFSFTRDLVDATAKNPHPLVVEVGYRTIYPGSWLGAPEILYLLSFPRPTKAFRLYNRGKDYLRFVDGVPDSEPSIGFGHDYLKDGYRTFLKRWYLLCYFLFAFLAFSPLVFSKQVISGSWQIATAVAVGVLLVFGWVAAISLGKYASIFASEKFIELQSARSNNSFKPTPLRGAA